MSITIGDLLNAMIGRTNDLLDGTGITVERETWAKGAVARQLADALDATRVEHAAAFPGGDWKAVNRRAGRLMNVVDMMFPELYGMTSEETLRRLRAVEG